MIGADLRSHIEKLVHRQNLTDEEVSTAFNLIADGKAESHQIAALLILLRAKGETPQEIAQIANVMLEHAIRVELEGPLLDIVGTGGDGANTVNVSTAAAIIASACGARVAKHGNRSVSSRSGSADVLEALGVPMLQPSSISKCLEATGVSFLYAPFHHPALKNVAEVRKSLRVRTIFNIMGPLLNPARVSNLVVGVYTPELLEPVARVFGALGVKHALVIHCCGLDELTPIGPAQAVEVKEGSGDVRKFTIDPEAFGIPKCTLADLKGGSAAENAAILTKVLSGGPDADGPIGNTLALNAGAGLYVYGDASSIQEGYEIAKKVLRSGAALEKLQQWSATAQALHKQEQS